VIARGDIYWADFGVPAGSEAGYARPVVVVQGDRFNRSTLATVVCIPLTGTLRWSNVPGSVLLKSSHSGLDRDNVAQAHLITAVSESRLRERIGRVSDKQMTQILSALDAVLGR
jgi:mRNA interferase MazF